MGLAEQFELLELIHRDKAETWLARERNSNRRLLLHRFKETSGLRERLLAMGPADLIMLVGAEKEGDSYVVVTHDAPALRKFSDWAESRSAPGVPMEKPSHPATREERPPSPDPQRTVMMPAQVRDAQISGEFDLLFATQTQSPVRSPFDDDSVAGPVTASSPGLTNESFEEPGEFTRMFRTPPASPANTEPAPRNDSPASPGEFTMMFQPPAPLPANNKDALSGNRPSQLPESRNPSPPNRPSSTPGDFTRAFQAMSAPPEPAPPARDLLGRDLQKPPQSREIEFKDSFRSASDAPTQSFPARPSWETGKSASDQPGEFTKIFNSPFATPSDDEKLESPLLSQPQRPSRTARPPEMFPRSSDRTPYDSASDSLDRGATGIFVNSKPAAADSAQPPKPAGPGEYTRIFQQPVTPPPQEAAKEAESPKQPAAAQPNTPPPAKNPLPLVIVLGILAVASIALLLYFSLRR